MNLFSYATLAGYMSGSTRACCCCWRWCRCCRCCGGCWRGGGGRWWWRSGRAACGPTGGQALRFVPTLVLSLSLALLLVAAARPQRPSEHLTQTGRGIDIMLGARRIGQHGDRGPEAYPPGGRQAPGR
ncbi:MAG: hypothetical protein WKG07_47570 [Hymenobacter sp.]